MIEKKIVYEIVCDRCGEHHIDFDSGVAEFEDADCARESAAQDGWVDFGDRHYCPNCYDVENNIDQHDIEY